jgi:hypothetical protein
MNRISLLLLFILAGCKNNTEPAMDPCADNLTASFESCSSVTTVSADKCIIRDALIQQSDGYIMDKFVYHHDGTNYDRIDRYYLEDGSLPFPETPTEIHNFSYKDGVISEVRYTAPSISPGVTWVSTYTYLDSRLKTHLDILRADGSVDFSQDFEEFYVSAPKDSLYYYDGRVDVVSDARALFEYKDGNLNRMGRPSSVGACTMYGAKFLFRKNYYDNVPNVLKDYAVRYPFIIGKGIYGIMLESYPVGPSANNIIGRFGNDGLNDAKDQYCWTFLKNATQTYWIKTFKSDDRQFTITYHYDCE